MSALHLGAVVRHAPWETLAAVALGGMAGASARFGIQLAWPAPAHGFPFATFLINVTGCTLIGVLMVVITEIGFTHRLARPFLGTGVLGGFTTFSTYAVEVQRLVDTGAARVGLVYLIATPTAALAAVWLGTVLTRLAVRK